jgi:2-iminobutanoate/2-iminopropanoate deaminase
MLREVVSTPNAPAAIGPYSQAIKANGFVFVSGCIGIHPETKQLAGSIEDQTRQVLQNLKSIVEASGSSLEKVCKTTILLSSMSDFATVNSLYSEYFPTNPPARATFAVAGLPLGAAIEIECTALA